MWSPWKCEMMTVSTWPASMPEALRLPWNWPVAPLLRAKLASPRAGVDDDQLRTRVDGDRRIGDRDHIGCRLQEGGGEAGIHFVAALVRNERIGEFEAVDTVGRDGDLVRADFVAIPSGVLRPDGRRLRQAGDPFIGNNARRP